MHVLTSRKYAGLEAIRRANWTGLGLYLENLVGEDIASPEILQLIVVLKSPSVTFDDIMWEPALWDAKTRMSFIRRVAACIDWESLGGRARRLELKKLPALRLQGCIDKLGLQIDESTLIDSVTFLRNKVAAHYNETYSVYPGQKEDIGLERETIGRFLLKEKPDYMMKLIKHIRLLGWIPKSPIAPRTTATASRQGPASS
ncbi:uncharacterized protein LOC119321082 [Triticum dicoccoides]|uniref:uncharacterized protein LOC119321082 n=1 Tax=Triticum dicoccoides TaxID=85692 RepID=UPI0018918EFC|nr:uncharacterized protein LOC119321082 [Triticum dicoccoides]